MDDKIELRVDRKPPAGLEVHFWQGDRRIDAIHLDGGADEIKIGDSFVTDTISAWARVMIRQTDRVENGGPTWEVVYTTNVVNDDQLASALGRINERLEQLVRSGASGSIEITEDLRLPGWELAIE